MTRVLTVIVILMATSGVHAADPVIQPKELKRAVAVEMKYLLFLPRDYDGDQAKKWPLIIHLHGSGERGDDIDRVRRNGPPKVAAARPDFPFVVAAPQCPKERFWEAAKVVALLDEVLEKYRCDPDRVYLTGLSMGGSGTWDTACHYPERFAAIAPVCGSGMPWRANYLKTVPAWAFHGAKDSGVPVERTEQMCEAMKKAGGDVKFTCYADLGHDCWTVTYDNPELYEWFLKHSRKSRSVRPANPARKPSRRPVAGQVPTALNRGVAGSVGLLRHVPLVDRRERERDGFQWNVVRAVHAALGADLGQVHVSELIDQVFQRRPAAGLADGHSRRVEPLALAAHLQQYWRRPVFALGHGEGADLGAAAAAAGNRGAERRRVAGFDGEAEDINFAGVAGVVGLAGDFAAVAEFPKGVECHAAPRG